MHGKLPTYEFYVDECCGQLSVEAFHAGLAAAARLVRWAVGGREPAEEQLDVYRRAVCAAVDCYMTESTSVSGAADEAEEGAGAYYSAEGQVSSYSIGDFTVRYHEPQEQGSSNGSQKADEGGIASHAPLGDDAALGAALRELAGSGLAFTGAR